MADNDKYKHLKAAGHITQFGLDMVAPMVLCIIIATWIKNAFNTGSWIVIVAIITGVACSVLNMIKFIKAVNNEMGGKEHDKKRED